MAAEDVVFPTPPLPPTKINLRFVFATNESKLFPAGIVVTVCPLSDIFTESLEALLISLKISIFRIYGLNRTRCDPAGQLHLIPEIGINYFSRNVWKSTFIGGRC